MAGKRFLRVHQHCKLGFYQELQAKVEQLKNSNRELEKKRQEIQALLDGITDLMLVLSEDLRIQRVNHVFSQWFPGVDPIGRHCYDILCGEERRCGTCPARRSLDQGEIVKDLCMYKVNGRFRQFEVIASPLTTEPSGEQNVLLFKRDVTLEKELQAKFNQAEKMATVGALAAGVAHEINNPLAAISGFAEGLQRRIRHLEGVADSELLEDFNDYTQTIIKECLRCRDIVQTLLTFSRPTTASIGPLNVNRCVTDTLFILKHHLKDMDRVKVTLSLAPKLPMVTGDESQLKQVIINLFTNAFDAVDGAGEIRIITRTGADGAVELVVEDDGCGIPPESLDKLFEPFYTTKPVGKGVGIGLSTCYSIVSNHKGEITVASELGRGASFTVRLPAVED
ncbi:MAG: two-component system sensor histidine kinase NtrB [Desulfopila sp.]